MNKIMKNLKYFLAKLSEQGPLVILVGIVCSLGGYYFLLGPLQEANLALDQQRERLSLERRALEAIASRPRDLELKERQYGQRLKELEAQLPPARGQNQLLDRLTSLAREKQVQLISTRFLEAKQHKLQALELELKGDFPELLSFIEALEREALGFTKVRLEGLKQGLVLKGQVLIYQRQ